MASSGNGFSSLPFLWWLEKSLDFGCPLSSEVRSLRLKVNLLQVFLSCGGKHHNNIENRRLQSLLVHPRTVFRGVDLDVGRCWADFIRVSLKNSFGWLPMNMDDMISSLRSTDLNIRRWRGYHIVYRVTPKNTFGWLPMNMDDRISSKNSFGRLPMNLDNLLSSVLERLELLEPDIREIYTILSKSSRSTLHADSKVVMQNLYFLLENIEYLLFGTETVAPVHKELKAAINSLSFLRVLLGFTTERCSKLGKLKHLVIHAEFLTDKMSCLLYMCSFHEKMNDSMVNEMKMNLSSELQRDVRQIYIQALKASKSAQGDSAVVDKFDQMFLNSLGDNILQLLPDTASNKDQILSLHAELRFLTTSFATQKSSETHSVQSLHIEAGIPYKLDQICNYIVERISAAIVDMGCLVYSLHNNEQNTDEAKELKRAVSDLHDIIKIAKDDARKAYDMYIPKSWQSKTMFRTTNADGVVRSLKKIYKIMESFPGALIPYGFLYTEHEKEMHSLIIAFSELTASQVVEHEELEILMMRLNDIRNETKNLISSFSHGLGTFWSHKLWLFVLFENIMMIKMEFNLPNIGPYIRALSELDYPVLSDDEAEETEEQMINGSKRSHIFSYDAGMRGFDYQLRWLETNLDLTCPLKNEVKELRLRAGFLKVFLCFKGKWQVEDGNLKVLLTRICVVFQNANQDLQRLWAEMIQISQKNEWCLPMNMDCLLSSAAARLQLLKPDIQEVYTILSKSSRFITGMSDEAVMENLNSLQENIEDLLRCNAELTGCVKERLEAFRNGLRFLRNFLGFTAKRCSKLGKLKDLLIHAEFLADSMSCLLYLCCVDDKMDDWTMNELKMHILSKLQKFSSAQPDVREIYFRALKSSNSVEGNSNVMDEFDLGFLDSLRDNILDLSNTNPNFITSTKDQILSLLDKLKFLITFCAMDKFSEQHPEHDQMSNNLFRCINAVIIDIGCVIYSLNDDDEKNEKMARELELNNKISDLEAIINVAKKDMYDLSVRSLRSDFPRTNGQGFIGYLLRNLNELLNTKGDLVAPLEHHIEIAQKEVLSLREYFREFSMQQIQCEKLQSLWTHFLEIAYQIEYVIDSFLAGDRPVHYHKLGLFNVIEDIKTIKIELKAMENKMADDPSQFSVESKNNAVLSYEERLVDEKGTTKLVIFGEEAEKIREQLMRGYRKLNIISIVGMPGIGKTTLADSLLQHSSVTYHFHVRARCSVSQVHDKRRLLLEILQQVTAEKKQYGDDDDVDQKLYQSLKGRRYLILLDDLWDIKPWEHMKASFPDDENGSRIILTSRFDDIATQAGLEIINFRLSPLPEEKSWEMLQVKLFGNKSCPPDLASAGYEIAANCKGLPLTIDLVAGALRMKQIKEWKKVAESLMAILFGDPERRCWKVLELSYQNLPEDLKPCFLYFAAFPEDANVPTRDLILLWISEGFVKLEKGETKSLEDVAKDILDNLISRSLVMVSRRGPLGGVDASHVHDLLHEFSVAKAQEESFMLKVDREADFDASHLHDQWRRKYRLCIYPGNLVQFPKANSSSPHTRALICSQSLVWDHLSMVFGIIKLLRVLYIPNVLCPYCPEMFRLIHLRLLAISTSNSTSKIFSKIYKLQNLETLIVEYRNGPLEYFLPHTISNMVRLRHLCFGGYVSFRYSKVKILEKSSLFDNLRSLYHLQASCGEDVEKILKLMPNLVDLKVLFYDSDRCWHPFPRLDFLKKLESLEVFHQNIYDPPYAPHPSMIISFPPHLKRLVLSNFGMPWTKISEIGNLEYLEVLELKKGAFRGPIWDMSDGQLPKLKYLCLSDLDIEEWNASEDHFSCFEQLHVMKCRKLKELPSCLAEIGTLQTIEIFYCTEAAENSAKRIKEEQAQMGNEQLVVDITKAFWKDV